MEQKKCATPTFQPIKAPRKAKEDKYPKHVSPRDFKTRRQVGCPQFSWESTSVSLTIGIGEHPSHSTRPEMSECMMSALASANVLIWFSFMLTIRAELIIAAPSVLLQISINLRTRHHNLRELLIHNQPTLTELVKIINGMQEGSQDFADI